MSDRSIYDSDTAIAALRDRLSGRTPAPAAPAPLTTDEAIAQLRDRLSSGRQ